MSKTSRLAWALSLLSSLALSGAGCQQGPSARRIYYEPQPSLAEVVNRAPGAAQQVPLTVLASVQGVRPAEPKRGAPAALDVSLRFENHGPSAVEFDPGSLELLTGSLRALPPRQVQPPGPVYVPASQTQTVTARFPLPPGLSLNAPEMSNLRLDWQVTIDGRMVRQSAPFFRATESGEYMPNDPLAG